MAKKKTKKAKKDTEYEYPPFGEKEFWDRHEKARQAKIRKDSIGNDVREFIRTIVEKYTEDGYDPRRDIAWYLEQLGNNLRGDVEREIAAVRRAQMKPED